MTSDWIELSIETPPEYVEPLTEIFFRYGEGGVAVEQPGGFNPDEGEEPPTPDRVTVKTYLPRDASADRRRAQIDVSVRLVAHLAPVSELRERLVSEEDWQDNWKEFFYTLRVGKRIVICPTWREHDPQPDDVVVHLDPGMAFGTGHHPTTRMCIETIERIMPRGARVLDLGCGSAILSIAAQKLGAESVVGLEIDPIAAGAGYSNVGMNDLRNSVDIVNGTLPSPKAPAEHFDLIVANISAKVIIDLAARVAECAAPGAKIIASGIIEKHVPDVTRALENTGMTIEDQLVDGDWIALIASV